MADIANQSPKPHYRLARLALVWERLWPSLWPALAVLLLFACYALFDIGALLPGWARVALLALFGAALLAALVQAWRRFDWPGHGEARRRLELASQLRHRPLTTIEDRPAGGDPASLALWRAHRERALAAARSLKVGAPRAGLLRRDPRALRVALVLAVIVGAIGAGNDAMPRLVRALTPTLTFGPPVPVTLDLWITPPAYTGLPPLFASALPHGQTLQVPTGSALFAQVSGAGRAPTLTIGSGKPADFETSDKHNFRIEQTLTEGTAVSVRADGTLLGSWPISIIPDNAPTVRFARDPGQTARAALRLDYEAQDDYGVDSVTATIRRTDRPDDPPIELTLGRDINKKQAKGASFTDLTAHPWAGLPVEITLTAKDGIGQTGTSPALNAVLPEREFTNPVARAIVDQRKRLVRDPTKTREVSQALTVIATQTKSYGEDSVVFLSLMAARARLILNPKDLEGVEQLMWDTALRVEEGDIGQRERELRQAEQNVRDAMQRNAPDPELQKAIDELRQALDRFLESMVKQALQKPMRQQNPNGQQQTITSRQLQQMLDRAQQLAQNGQREAAQALLDQLRDILENLQNADPQMADDDSDQGDNAQQQAMDQLQDLIRKERSLQDRSMRSANRQQQRQQGQRGQQGQRQQGQQGQRGQQGDQQQGDADDEGDDDESLSAEQEDLRKQLGDLMAKLGEMGDIPQGLGKAEQSMRGASGALKRGQPGQALGPEGNAIDQLREGARGLAEQMQARQGQGPGRPGQATGSRAGQRGGEQRSNQVNRDPFGRQRQDNGTSPDNDGGITIPDNNQLQHAKEIYDELRRRSTEQGRPEIERDYIDRLLKQY